MIKLEEMYQGMPFSPDTYLTKAINETDTEIHINDVSVFPPAPNIATIGNDKDGEVIKYTSSFNGVLSGCTRGVVGTPKSWPINTVIARNYSSEDQRKFIKNILALDANKVDKVENKDLVNNEEINKLKSITINNENKITNDVTGNANTATKFKAPVNIFGLSFDGSKDIAEDDNHKLVTKTEKIIIKESSNPNLLINGDFQVWQRGTIFENHTGYTADRWWTTQTAKVERVRNTSPMPVLYNIKVTCNGWSWLAQPIEFISNYIGKTLTASFYARSTDGTTLLACAIATNMVIINLTSEWKLYNVSIIVPNINYNNTSTYDKGFRFHSANAIKDNSKSYEISSVKLELGEVATPFVPRLYAEEEILCKRYFERIGNGYSATLISLHKTLVNDILTGLLYFTAKRISPSIIFSEFNQYRCYLTSGGNALGISNVIATSIMLDRAFIYITAPNNFTVGTHFLLQRTDPATKAWIDIDAEIY